MHKKLLVSLLFLTSCYHPSLPSGSFRCGADSSCPDGLTCAADGLCRTPGDPADSPDMEASRVDLSLPPGTDLMSSGDLSGSDLKPPADLSAPPDMTPVGPCKGGAAMLDTGLYACSGTFAAGQAATLCNPGYHLCTGWSSAKNPMDACKADFFVTGATLSLNINPGNGNIMNEYCDATTGSTQALLGCGNYPTPRLPAACHNLKVQLPCNNTVTGWSCTNGISDAANSNPTGGALCCAD